ncbi:hypothetical protein [Streptomyces zagrosensis]|uniref:Uncharacterized protein n=1 Tax=Streptomyces zagrosensis TaxID=1042984 RepID=A0A7W9Q7L1_9ACTN|nr:hypothetical protein [Streptomyces zagrosensis]MBB5935050.1 hypothetical protein [Streptomyces zagrosensis]
MIESVQEDEQFVGVRTYAQVDAALKGLSARRDDQPQLLAGEAAALQWAMGHLAPAPVTGASASDLPDLRLLTAEVDATVVQLDDITTSATSRDYLRGVHDALLWICGYSDDPL